MFPGAEGTSRRSPETTCLPRDSGRRMVRTPSGTGPTSRDIGRRKEERSLSRIAGLRPAGVTSLPRVAVLRPAPRGALDVAFGIPGGDVLPLVVQFLAAGQPDRKLHAWSLEVEPQRDQGQSLLPGLPDEVVDLLPLQEQLPGPQRVDDPLVPMRVGGDVHVLDVRIVPPDRPLGVLDVDAPLADRFDLVPVQYHPAFDVFEDVIFVPGPPVRGDRLLPQG